MQYSDDDDQDNPPKVCKISEGFDIQTDSTDLCSFMGVLGFKSL
jgi:hypothetical protein